MGVVDLPQTALGAANVLMSINQQLIGALAVSISTLVLQVASHGSANPAMNDFRISTGVLIALGLVGLTMIARTRMD